ncbi:hypothetical protein [Nitrincola sp.]|uniref:hypothetical protein n=1 Tax=Nitrincola sp. TaxID=1926584 RepID=UPI003A945483
MIFNGISHHAILNMGRMMRVKVINIIHNSHYYMTAFSLSFIPDINLLESAQFDVFLIQDISLVNAPHRLFTTV